MTEFYFRNLHVILRQLQFYQKNTYVRILNENKISQGLSQAYTTRILRQTLVVCTIFSCKNNEFLLTN